MFQTPESAQSAEWLSQTAVKLLRAGTRPPGIKAIDISEVPTSLTPLVAGLLARLIYDIQFWTEPALRTPVCLVCDEAHVYLRDGEGQSPMHAAAMRRFETIAKEGRKYGVCLAVVSQRPSELNETVLSQCNNFVILRLSNDQDHESIVQLVPGAFAGVADVLPTLDVGEAVVIGDAVPLPVGSSSTAPASARTARPSPTGHCGQTRRPRRTRSSAASPRCEPSLATRSSRTRQPRASVAGDRLTRSPT